MTSSVDGPRRSSKAFSKAKLAPPPKKVTVTVWWSAPSLIHYTLLNPSKTITFEKHAQQIDVMYQKLQCLQPALVNRMGPILFHDNINCTSYNQHFKSWTNYATKFCLIHRIHLTSHQLTTTFSTILTTFCRENASITSRRQKMLSWEFVESQRMDFYVIGINKLISGQNVLIVMCWL